jgi:transposase
MWAGLMTAPAILLSVYVNLTVPLQQSESFRRVATRYDKLAANYLAALKLASVRLWLRAYESTPSYSLN